MIGLVDEAGKRTHTYAYTPYGTSQNTTEAFPQPYRYAGAYLGPTGLYKMGARYYDPHLGRFTQPDPSGQETNPYLYATGDPINHTDPTGLLSFDIGAEGCYWLCIGGGVSINEDGSTHPFISFGMGNPGGSADASLASGSADKGWTGEVSCGYGPFSLSAATDGSESVGTGGSSGKCSLGARYTF
ncbi:RHS repeat-associated core domain-containing protein [Streptomyces sp. NPDC007910]|uniref:RHS repeat-associated core domain-containing protein n=1 Tax=Streptomyces sp. NPDC007910 TaxID=3364790 RepID=UPI0036ED9BCB